MTEPFLTSKDLHPIVALVFRRRFRLLAVFLVFTFGTYGALKALKSANYSAASVVMVKIPLVDYEYRVDPNPQASSVYLALAVSDGLLADSFERTREIRERVQPIAEELGLPEFIPADRREDYLHAVRSKPEQRQRLREFAESLEEDWLRTLVADPAFLVGLFEIAPEDVAGLPLFRLQESFKVRSKVAVQTNVTAVLEPFLSFSVTWDSPGAAAALSNVWGRLFVERANRLTIESGNVTEDSLLSESGKMEVEASALQSSIGEMEAAEDYQKMKRADALERLLYGSKNTFKMHGYVEFEGEMMNEQGLASELELLKARTPEEATRIASMAERVEALSEELRSLRAETVEFRTTYNRAKANLLGIERIFGDRLTTTLFTHSRIKGGYYNPPMVFVERAIPSKQPTGPPKSILGLAVGVMASLAYLCWILYAGYVAPSMREGAS